MTADTTTTGAAVRLSYRKKQLLDAIVWRGPLPADMVPPDYADELRGLEEDDGLVVGEWDSSMMITVYTFTAAGLEWLKGRPPGAGPEWEAGQ